ncbi:MAG: hypothetical protein ACLVG5_10045 [Clostridium sp.]
MAAEDLAMSAKSVRNSGYDPDVPDFEILVFHLIVSDELNEKQKESTARILSIFMNGRCQRQRE